MNALMTILNIYLLVQDVVGLVVLLRARALYRWMGKVFEDFEAGSRHAAVAADGDGEIVTVSLSATDNASNVFAYISRNWADADDVVRAVSSLSRDDLAAAVVAANPALAASSKIPETRYWYALRDEGLRNERHLCLWSDCTDDAIPGGFYCGGHQPYMSLVVAS